MEDDDLFAITNKIENYFRRLLRNGEIDKDYYAKFMVVNMEMLENGVDDRDFEIVKHSFSKKYDAKLKLVDTDSKKCHNNKKGSKKGK